MFRRKLKTHNYALAFFNTYLMDSALLSLNNLIFEEEKRRAAILKAKKLEAKKLARESRSVQRALNINNQNEIVLDIDYGNYLYTLLVRGLDFSFKKIYIF